MGWGWIPEDVFQTEDCEGSCEWNIMLFDGRISNEVLLPEGWTRLGVEDVNISEASIGEDISVG